MHQARAYRLEHSVRQTRELRVAGRDAALPPPAWRILAWSLGIAMALWATGIVQLPASQRRLVDVIGAAAVLTILVVWVRSNARSLAVPHDQSDPEDRLHVRLIRSRRPPLATLGGPHITPSRPPAGRFF